MSCRTKFKKFLLAVILVAEYRSFSERYGLAPKKVMQEKDMNDELRNSLYNAVFIHYLKPYRNNRNSNYCDSNLKALIDAFWVEYRKIPVDEAPLWWPDVCQAIKKFVKTQSWWRVYDLIEFFANNFDAYDEGENENFKSHCDRVLREEMTPYQFVGEYVTRLTSEQEIEQVEKALQTPVEAVKAHIKTAHQFLADRQNPNYRNSIKESISAVESVCYLLTDERHSFSEALKKLAKNGVEIPGALKVAFEKLYGWSSSEEGIRHALLDEPKLDYEEAIFALVSCSAFVNYLIIEAEKAGIKIDNTKKAL